MKKLVFISIVFILMMISTLYAQRENLRVENNSGITTVGCSYFVTPILVRFESCDFISATALKKSIAPQTTFDFTAIDLLSVFGSGYLYVGAAVESLNGPKFVYSCNDGMIIVSVQDPFADCGGDLLDLLYDENYSKGIARLEIFDQQ